MVRSALPPHIDEKEEWKGTDQDVWYKWWWLQFRINWLTFGPRAKEWWARWREMPITLFCFYGPGYLRYENSDGSQFKSYDKKHFIFFNKNKDGYYPSRIQPWTRFHFNLQWPLYYNWHFIYDDDDVVTPPTYQSDFGIDKMITNGGGAKRDGDKVYVITANIGGNFE